MGIPTMPICELQPFDWLAMTIGATTTIGVLGLSYLLFVPWETDPPDYSMEIHGEVVIVPGEKEAGR